jgi:hypothetical protein
MLAQRAIRDSEQKRFMPFASEAKQSRAAVAAPDCFECKNKIKKRL